MYSPTHHPTRAKIIHSAPSTGARVKRSVFSITTYFLAVFLMVIFLHARFPQFVIYYYYHNYYCMYMLLNTIVSCYSRRSVTLSICVARARVIVVQQSSACAFRVGFTPMIITYIRNNKKTTKKGCTRVRTMCPPIVVRVYTYTYTYNARGSISIRRRRRHVIVQK